MSFLIERAARNGAVAFTLRNGKSYSLAVDLSKRVIYTCRGILQPGRGMQAVAARAG